MRGVTRTYRDADPMMAAQPDAPAPLGRFLLLGVLLWAAATVALRLAGHLVLKPEPAWLWGTFVVGALVLMALAVGLRRLLLPGGADADALALGIVGPGLVLDAGGLLLFPRVFPNLDPTLDGTFGAVLLWGYGLIALAIAVEARWSAAGQTQGGRSDHGHTAGG